MKKLLCLMIACILCGPFVFTACSNVSTEKSSETAEVAQSDATVSKEAAAVEDEDVQKDHPETEKAQLKENDSQSKDGGFEYVHDPGESAQAMADIIKNPDAVYGFSPNPQSKRLGTFAQYDWTDPKVVAQKQELRREYHKSMESMIDILRRKRKEGASIKEMASAISEERNRLRLESYKDDPEGLAAVKESNLKTYGHEEGPTPDELFKKYGSWVKVLQSAFGTNMGMDACCGLYDEYYWLYLELGYVDK